MFPCEDSKTVSVRPSVHLSVCPHPEKRNHHSFVNISPTLVIDTSMERSSRVLHHGNPKMWNFFQKVRNWILSVPRVSVCREIKSPWLRQYQFYVSNWYVYGKVFTSTTTWEPRNLIFFWSSKLNSTCILTCAEELKSFKKVSTCTYMSTSGMHRRLFEGRHLVAKILQILDTHSRCRSYEV